MASGKYWHQMYGHSQRRAQQQNEAQGQNAWCAPSAVPGPRPIGLDVLKPVFWQVTKSVPNSCHDLFSLYLDVVSPALVAIGARWAGGNLHIHEEHRASTIVARLFARVSARFAHRGPSRGTIVIGGPSGERHGLALTMVADLLRSRGWNVSDIGPDMPAESFATAVQNIDQLRAVCVGVTLRESLPAAKSAIAAVNRVVPNDVTIYVGGAAVTSDADARQLGADTWAKDPRTLVTLLSQTD